MKVRVCGVSEATEMEWEFSAMRPAADGSTEFRHVYLTRENAANLRRHFDEQWMETYRRNAAASVEAWRYGCQGSVN